MYLLVIKQLITMTLIVLAGFAFAKAFKIGASEQKFLSKMLLYFINPCLVVNSFNMEFDILKLKQLGFVAIVAVLIHGVLILISTILNWKDNDINKVNRLATVFTNCGFMGIPLIRGVFGNEGVFYLMGYLVVFNIFLWTWGYYQMSGSINIKKIITNPNIIAVCLGLILFCMPFTLPEFIAKPVTMIGDLNTAVAMILIGVLFANFKMENGQLLNLLKCTVTRLVICSLFNLLLVWGIYLIFGTRIADCRLMLFVAYICSMCPSATSVPSMSVLFDKDTSYASLVVSVSSLACMFTLPTFVLLGEMIIK